ncbi:MAG: FAD-dependent oxidoreductase [Candidatus Bathyarchaeota archaeon]|nr:FAD-dependent oxidoreductase [Candidatus Bathyarchaeota archaeon]
MKFETTLQAIIPRTPDITSFRFPRPAGLNYLPGQFFFVTLRQDGKELTKHFSFSSSPTQPNYIEFTKKFTDHEYSLALKAAKVGDWVRIDVPYGEFTFTGEYPKIALLGGGIGITPFISIMQNAADKRLPNKITLFYGCRTPEDIAFRTEFEALANKNPNLKVVFVISQPPADWKGITGHITADLIKQTLPDYAETIYYACGPPPMVKAMQALVETLGLPKEKLRLEYFTGYQ